MKFPEHDTAIYIIGSIHSYLSTNPNYSQKELEKIITSIGPEVLLLEITPEDIAAPADILIQRYPPEFAKLRDLLCGKAEIAGFNWIHPGKQNNPRKRIARLLENVPLSESVLRYRQVTARIGQFLSSGTPSDVNSAAFDAMAEEAALLLRSILPEQSSERITAMHANLQQLIRHYQGRRIAIITGAKHRGHLIAFIEEHFPENRLYKYL